jgi:hypothetical protein
MCQTRVTIKPRPREHTAADPPATDRTTAGAWFAGSPPPAARKPQAGAPAAGTGPAQHQPKTGCTRHLGGYDAQDRRQGAARLLH